MFKTANSSIVFKRILVAALIAIPLLTKAQQLIKYVDLFIGTGGHGYMYPGAIFPFGMVQLSPDNGTHGWGLNSGYHYPDSVIAGFRHTHLSGTGIGDWCDISAMLSNGLISDTIALYRGKFSHANEKASPTIKPILIMQQ